MNRRSLIMAASAVAGVFGVAMASAAKGPAASKGANDADIARHSQTMIEEGRKTFRYDTFGSEAFWGDALAAPQGDRGREERRRRRRRLAEDRAGRRPEGRRGRAARRAEEADQGGQGRPRDPATTVALLKLNAVVGVTAFATPAGGVKSMGIQCAFCHSTVDDSFAPGIGKRLDGWANRDLNVGAIVSLAPNLKPFTDLLGVDEATVKKVLASWGPGRFDAVLDKDGKALRPDGKQAGTLIPPAFGLAGVNLATWTGFGSVPYWNAYVAATEMHGSGAFFDARFANKAQYPVSAQERLANMNTRGKPTSRRPSWPRCTSTSWRSRRRSRPRDRSTPRPFERGKAVFDGRAGCARCHVPPLFTEPGHNLHAPSEIGVDAFQADRSPTHAYRTAPLAGPVVAPEGRLLSRRPFRDADGRGQPLRHVHEAGPQQRRQERSGGVPEGDLTIALLAPTSPTTTPPAAAAWSRIGRGDWG